MIFYLERSALPKQSALLFFGLLSQQLRDIKHLFIGNSVQTKIKIGSRTTVSNGANLVAYRNVLSIFNGSFFEVRVGPDNALWISNLNTVTISVLPSGIKDSS